MTVLGVVGGSSGAGSAEFACALSSAAVRADGAATLIDLDPLAGGVDVVLGIAAADGVRWSGLHLDGGQLDPATLRRSLPRWQEVAVLASDDGRRPRPRDVRAVIEASCAAGTVVLSLAREPSVARAAALTYCDLVLVLVVDGASSLAAAKVVVATMGAARIGAVVRGSVRGSQRIAGLVGLPLVGSLPPARGWAGPAHPRSTMARLYDQAVQLAGHA